MKTDALFLELTKRNNIYLYKEINKDTVNQFEEKYSKFKNKFFYEQFTNSGGIIIDYWIRIYGCGDINVVEKNNFHIHPRQLHYENFSDQDLSTYAKMACDNRNVNAFGILGFPIPNAKNSNGISIVQPIKPEKINDIGSANFFRFPNIYYSINNEIYKIGSFQKRYD